MNRAGYEATKTKLALAHLALETGSLDEARGYLRETLQAFQKFGAQANLAEAQELARQLR